MQVVRFRFTISGMKAVDKVLNATFRQGESPRWHPQSGSLYWLDVAGQTLNAWQTDNDRIQQLSLPHEPGCFSFCSPESTFPDSILLATKAGFLLVESMNSGNITPVVDVKDDTSQQYGPDGACDNSGCFWVCQINDKKQGKADSWVSCLDTHCELHRKLGPLHEAAGISFSPDCDTLYYADAFKRTVYACEYDASTATPLNRRVFHRFSEGQGMPRGAAVDSEGCYWIAMFSGGKVVRLSPGGVIVEEITLPVKYPTSVTFGADKNSTLFITSSRETCSKEELEQYPDSGGIFAVEAGVTGLQEAFFQPIRPINKG